MDVIQSGDGTGSKSKPIPEHGNSTQAKITPSLGNEESTRDTTAQHQDHTETTTVSSQVGQEGTPTKSVSSRGDIDGSSDPSPGDTDDTVDGRYEVEYDTESVVSGFMCHLYQHVHSRQQYDDAPYAPDFENLHRRDSLSADIGRRLANIGDDIYERHGREMDYLLRRLNPNKDNVFKVFSTIASKTIADGISWGRILVLLCFGFRMLTQALSFGLPQGSLRTLVSSIVQVFILKKITDWISRNGGWAASLSFNPSASNLAMAFVIGACVASAVAAVYKKLC